MIPTITRGLICLTVLTSSQTVPPCSSQVYCHGELLDTIQRLDMFEESKYFVDMGLKTSEEIIVKAFNQLNSAQKKNSSFMFNWVNENFNEPGFEFVDVAFTIEDNPPFLELIKDETYKKWAHDLYKIWPLMGRGVKKIVHEHPEQTSFIPLDYHTIVPTGPDGRFRESYYWDTFWTAKGMLQSGLLSDVHEILLNFRDLISKFGFIPNGTRKYYTKRSQPPFYIMMVEDLINHQPEGEKINMIQQFISSMTDEFEWWEQNRNITVGQHQLYRFASDVNTNRPEAYLQDEEVLSRVNEADREQLASHITSAAESGWDFSYRWTGQKNIDNNDVLIGLRTRQIVPVDLNFILAYNAKVLSQFMSQLSTGDDDYKTKSEMYMEKFDQITASIESLLYNDTDQSYFDFDLLTNAQNSQFFASNYVPLFTQVWHKDINATQRQIDLLSSLQKFNVLDYKAGIPNSLKNTGQQWDYPNAWPPSTHMIIMGLFNSELDEAKKQAEQLASGWLRFNYELFKGTVLTQHKTSSV